MKTIQIAIDDTLLVQLDTVVQELGASRSAFIRHALQSALRQHEIGKLEARHTAGYIQHPVQSGEFDGWEDEQVWSEP